MKKIFLTLTIAAALVACGQQDKDNKQSAEQTEKKVVIPPGMPTPPVSQAVPQPNNTYPAQSNTDRPVLNIEEGSPLDLSQIMGKKNTMEEQAKLQIDSIRYKAEQGNADFQYLLGTCYDNGWGVDANYGSALEWFQKAAKQNQKAAFNAIGNMHRMGRGTKQNDKEAFVWYEKGAEAKDPQAMLNVGNCYYYGMGTGKDIEKAVTWWQEAAHLGNEFAMSQLGDCYLFGIGMEKDIEKAVENLSMAADKNVPSAQYRLGILYYSGQGVKRDVTYSELLMKKARDGGMKEAQDFLDTKLKK